MMEFSVAGKVFLAGEYLALSGGAALLAAVGPRFYLTAQKSYKKNENLFHPDSIAGKLWQLNHQILEEYEIKFKDPYKGTGGFGGSTAEYLLLSVLLCQIQKITPDVIKILKDYREIASAGGYLPSGADLVAQFQGGVTFFSREQGRIQSYPWPFFDLGFFVGKTKEKLKTHEHLAVMSEFKREHLSSAMKNIERSLESRDSQIFTDALCDFSTELSNLGFVTESTRKILENLSHPQILARKGCGAMGADVVLVVYNKRTTDPDEIKELMTKHGLKVVASENDVSEGIKVQLVQNQSHESII